MDFQRLERCIRRRFANNSRSREAVYRVLCEAGSHCLSAEEIRKRMREIHPREISPNTIYRHLDFLMECRLVRGLQAGNCRVFCQREEGTELYAVCPHCGTAVRLSAEETGWSTRIPDADYAVIYRRCKSCD